MTALVLERSPASFIPQFLTPWPPREWSQHPQGGAVGLQLRVHGEGGVSSVGSQGWWPREGGRERPEASIVNPSAESGAKGWREGPRVQREWERSWGSPVMRLLSGCHLSSQHRMLWEVGQWLGAKGQALGALGSGVNTTQHPDLEPFQDPALSSLRLTH